MIDQGYTNGSFCITELRQFLYGVVGWQFHAPGSAPDIMGNLSKWRMITSKSGEFDYNGTLSGVGFGGQAFRIADVTAAPLPGRIEAKDAGFHGVIVSFRQSKPFVGRTIVAEDKDVYNPTSIDLMQRVPFDCPDFEHVFEVYGDCEDEARAVITSGLVKRLTEFSQLTFGQKAQCVLTESDVHFALHIEDNFQFSKEMSCPSFASAKKAILTEAGNICVLFEKLYRIQASIGKLDTPEAAKQRLDYYQSCLLKMIEAGKPLTEAELMSRGEQSGDPVVSQLSKAPNAVMSGHDRIQRKAS